jgi:hypothetical protein
MVKLMLGLPALPSPHDAADALAVAICHLHSRLPPRMATSGLLLHGKGATSWRQYRVGARTKDQRPRTKDQGPRTKDQGPRTKDQGPRTS